MPITEVPWILPVAPSRSPAIGVAVKEALVCFLAALSDENDADRLFTALPSALEGAGRACGVAHEKAGGNRKPK